MRKRPTVSLGVMVLLGAVWCYLLSTLQGETTWEPTDQGWFAAWWVQFIVISDLLVFLWFKRVHPLVIVSTPIAIQALAIVLALLRNTPHADNSNSSTFEDGFMEIFQNMIIATVVVAGVIGIFAVHRHRRSAERSVSN